MAYDKDKMAAQMNEGEHVRPAPLKLPIISLEGNEGIFNRSNVGEDGKMIKKEKIGQMFQGVIIGIRMQLSESGIGKKISHNSTEFDKSTDHVTIFSQEGKDGPRKKVFEGPMIAAQEKYTGLKQQRWLYMLVGGELVKYRLKGGSMTYFFKFLQELSRKKLHTFQVLVKLDPVMEHNEEINKDYYASVITIVRELTDDEVEKKVQPEFEGLHAKIETMRSFTLRPKVAEHVEGVDNEAEEELPSINLDENEPAGPGAHDDF